MSRSLFLLTTLLAFAFCGTTLAAESKRCDLEFLYRAEAKFDVWMNEEENIVYFKSNIDVNTDGSGRSYHPVDIAGNKGLAQNLICNGVKRRTGKTSLASCVSACQACLDKFRSVRLDSMIANFGKYFRSIAIATDGNRACVVPKGSPNEGFFVSTTSYQRIDKDVCDQEKYLDSMIFPAIAVPDRLVEAGVKMGDLVVVRNRFNKRYEYAVVSDTSGSRIGEGSIALNRSLFCLGGKPGCVHPDMPTTVAQSYGLVIDNADFLIFKASAAEWPKSIDVVATRAKQLFADWGGEAVLDDCVQRYAPH